MKRNDLLENPLFLRNTFPAVGQWGIPQVKKQALPVSNPELISCSNVRSNESAANKQKGVHFFVYDYRFGGLYEHPEKGLKKYAQYAFLLTPDFSTYADMPLWRQIENVAKNRWCGAYWQSQGLTVIPSISWSTPRSFSFCFDGVEKNAPVAVSTVGCRKHKVPFLRGYNAMMEKLEPCQIICLGKPFEEMEGNVIPIDYFSTRRVVH